MPTTRHSRAERELAKVDWRRVDATTDAEIARQAAGDAETAPLFTAAELAAVPRQAGGEIQLNSASPPSTATVVPVT